jgi:hypothetical protein
MTQEARTTESESRDNAAIRELMHGIKELTVPDRATLALGLIGHLATLMNSRQMEKLLMQLTEEASKVQDVPPSRQGGSSGARATAAPAQEPMRAAQPPRPAHEGTGADAGTIGQSGRGPVTEDRSELL